MKTKTPSKIIRTDKWKLNPTRGQKVLFGETVKMYRRFCRFLTGIVFTHWGELGELSSSDVVPAVERLIHSTAKNPEVKYPKIDQYFRKFPSYYRRAAIVFTVGQVRSYMTRYWDWVSGIRSRRDTKPPILNSDSGCYPVLYRGQCYKLYGTNKVEIKVFNGKDWIWTTVQITGCRERHTVASNKQLSPSLIFNPSTSLRVEAERSRSFNSQACYLSVPFECHPKLIEGEKNVVGVDLGINTTATVVVVNYSGTVIHREFIHPGRDIDRRDKRLKSISSLAAQTMGRGGKLHKSFCSNTYRKCRHINEQISHIVSKRIVEIAKHFNSDTIVFENLKGWKPKGGRRRSNLRQRFHNWLKSKIRDYTEMKWREVGGKIVDVIAAYTSKLA